jgi:hypothetical protein
MTSIVRLRVDVWRHAEGAAGDLESPVAQVRCP